MSEMVRGTGAKGGQQQKLKARPSDADLNDMDLDVLAAGGGKYFLNAIKMTIEFI